MFTKYNMQYKMYIVQYFVQYTLYNIQHRFMYIVQIS